MAIETQQPTDEQTKQDQTTQESLHKSVKDTLMTSKVGLDILKDLGLSPGNKQEEEPKKEEVPQEETQEEILEQDQEEVQEEVEETQEQESEDEEVIPKSKVQKRFDELTAKNKYLEQQIEELKSSSKPKESKDEITKQLEGMRDDQLKAAKIEVRKAQIKAQNDDAKLNELLDLEEKINGVLQGAPERFAKAQTEAYLKVAKRIENSGEVQNLDKSAPEILKIANEIYKSTPILQKDINGQAAALELAIKHYKGISNIPGDKTKETELKRQVNNLKRKTTLDTKTSKGNIEATKLENLRKSAINGTLNQKVELVKTHPMFDIKQYIPEEFRGG